jgi:carbonic anhydrase/acetyltransferase-like protein (isoleucine patch superfamily)
MPVFVHGKQVAESCLLLLENCILDGCKFGTNVLIIGRFIGEGGEDLERFVFLAL